MALFVAAFAILEDVRLVRDSTAPGEEKEHDGVSLSIYDLKGWEKTVSLLLVFRADETALFTGFLAIISALSRTLPVDSS